MKPATPALALRRRHGRGVTLIELMIAMTISLLIAATALMMFGSARAGFTFVGNTVRLTEDGSFALDAIARDVRMAGFAGCAGTQIRTDTTVSPPAVTYVPALTAVPAASLNGLAEEARPNPFLGTVATLGDTVMSNANTVWGFDAVNGTLAGILGGSTSTYLVVTTQPVLYVAGGASRALQLSAPMATTAAPLTVEANTYNWTGAPFMIVASCEGSDVFRASGVASSGGALTVTPSTALSRTYNTDAILMPLTWALYFVATRSGADTPSLYRMAFDGRIRSVEELVPGVEALRLHYGENTSNVGAEPAWVADVTRTSAATVSDWSRVLSVRIGLVMVGTERGQQVTADSSVQVLGATYTPTATDRRLRRVYSASVQIRNRVRI